MTFSFFLSIYSRCGAPASWAARHTTVCLDYGVLQLPAGRHTLTFSGGHVKFGAIIYGSSGIDTYALPVGMKLNLATDLPSQGMLKSDIHNMSYLCTILQFLHQFKMQY